MENLTPEESDGRGGGWIQSVIKQKEGSDSLIKGRRWRRVVEGCEDQGGNGLSNFSKLEVVNQRELSTGIKWIFTSLFITAFSICFVCTYIYGMLHFDI